VLFLLCSELLLELELELLLELELELLVELELELFDELVELCFFSYSSRSSLRFLAHSGFSLWLSFLKRQILSCNLFPSIPRPTANSAEHPLAFVGAFKTWLGLPALNELSTTWHSDCLFKPAFLPHFSLALKSSPSARPSMPVM